MKLALPEQARPLIEARLPAGLEVTWFSGGILAREQAAEAAVDAEVLWLDVYPPPAVAPIVDAARELRWLSTSMAGVTGWPLDSLADRGVILTNGAGLNAGPVAEFAVMGVLVMAKNMRELVYAQDRKEFVMQAPGRVELAGTRALVVGWGQIGREIGRQLKAFNVEVTGVRRNPDGEPGVIGPDAWKGRLGEFDWIVLATASTRETAGMIGPAELKAMKPSAVIVNIARGDLIDQAALIQACADGTIAGAFLDVTHPEPAPQDDPIWTAKNIVLTHHTAGRAQTGMPQRSAALFLDNLERYRTGQPLRNLVDLKLGY